MNDMSKAGWKTSEFWFSLGAVVVAYLISSDLGDETTVVGKILGIVATVLAAFGYSIGRAMVKSASIKAKGNT